MSKLKGILIVLALCVVAAIVGNFNAVYNTVFPEKPPEPVKERTCMYEGMEGKFFTYSNAKGYTKKGKIIKVNCDKETLMKLDGERSNFSIDSGSFMRDFALIEGQ